MRKLQEINIFIFFIFLSIGLFIGLIFPDFDQSFQKLLGHRSIITHSILLPYLIYFYQIVKKEKPNNNIVYICIGIFLGIAIHLSADLFPKGWRGYALIKFIGDISIGAPLSILWMGANVYLGTQLAAKLFKNLTSKKIHIILYFIILLSLSFIYSVGDGGDSLAKFLTFTFFLGLTFYLTKGLEIKTKEPKKIKLKKDKKLEKKSKVGFWRYAVGIPLAFIIILIILGNL